MEKIKQATDFILGKTQVKPTYGIILGTGLGGLINEIEIIDSIAYDEIPHFPVSTVESHKGRLIFGNLKGKTVVAMQGRFHFYEGYSMYQVAFPVRVMKLLGIQRLFVSNACGGLMPPHEKGDLFIIEDHVNLFPSNPLIGKNLDELGPRFPDMSEPYDRQMIAFGESVLQELGINYHKGTYAGVPGPMLETPAEYRYIRNIGANVVGMSTIPEIIAARHMDLPCFAMSIITDLANTDVIEKVDVQEIIRTAMEAEPKLTKVISSIISRIDEKQMVPS